MTVSIKQNKDTKNIAATKMSNGIAATESIIAKKNIRKNIKLSKKNSKLSVITDRGISLNKLS